MKKITEFFDRGTAEHICGALRARRFTPAIEESVNEDLEVFAVVCPEAEWESAADQIDDIISSAIPWKSAVACPKCGSNQAKLDVTEDDNTLSTMAYRWTCTTCGNEWIQPY